MKNNCSNSGLEHNSNILNLIGITLSPTIKTEDFPRNLFKEINSVFRSKNSFKGIVSDERCFLIRLQTLFKTTY